jgi:hypothetical protein
LVPTDPLLALATGVSTAPSTEQTTNSDDH